MSGKVRHLRPLPSFGVSADRPAAPGEPIDAPGASHAALGAAARRNPDPPQPPSSHLPPAPGQVGAGVPISQPMIVQQPSARHPIPQQPIRQQPAAQQPAAQQPIPQQPAAQHPAAQQPIPQQPAAQQPIPQQPAAQQPIPQQPAVQQPLPQQPAVQQPLPQQPAAQRPIPQQPAVQQPLPQPHPPQQPTPQPTYVQPAAQAPGGGQHQAVVQGLPLVAQPTPTPTPIYQQPPAAQAPAQVVYQQPLPEPVVYQQPAPEPVVYQQPPAPEPTYQQPAAQVTYPQSPAGFVQPPSDPPVGFVSTTPYMADANARVLEPEIVADPDPIEIAAAPEEPWIEGVTPPQSRAHLGFVTDAIVQLGFLSASEVERFIEKGRTAGRSPESLMLEDNAIDSIRLSRAVAERYGLDHVDLGEYRVDMSAVNLVPAAAVKRFRAAPVGYVDPQTVLVAVSDPTNVLAVDDIKMMTGLDCRVAVASPEDIEQLIKRISCLDNAVESAVLAGEEEDQGEEEIGGGDLQASEDDAPVIKLVYGVLTQGVQQGTSDVHFEVEEHDMRVRFRIDGVLQEAATIPKRMMGGVISRLKIMADMDIAEKRIPQDGRISVNIEGEPIDMRITTLPTQRGEGATIRILDAQQAMLSLDDLGMIGEPRERFEQSFKKPYGCVLVTGPTGSGKSTSLYSALNELNQTERKIITIEDPVEFRVEGINQINVNIKAGLTFAAGLKSVLRADPDVVMVGEIRDTETARIAIEAALTGHMVLSTLHTNTAPGAVARLQKMGIENFLISSAVECVIAQRLARQLCTHCKKRTVIPQSALAEAGIRLGGELEAYEPDGCQRCGRSGYKGRIGLYSVMVLSERIKEMITASETEAEIEKAAREEGMLTLRESGLDKIRAGVTSLEEIARVTV